MGLLCSAEINENGLPVIFGSSSTQAGEGEPVVLDDFFHRVIVSALAITAVVNIVPVANKVLDVAATIADPFNASIKSSIEGFSSFLLSVTSGGLFLSADSISTGVLISSPKYKFIFEDASFEEHSLSIIVDANSFSRNQLVATNQVYFDYTYTENPLNPLSDYGIPNDGQLMYQFHEADSSEWISMGSVNTLEQFVYTFANAFTGLVLRMYRTVTGPNGIIYQPFSQEYTLNMTEATPSFSMQASDLYCECGGIDVSDLTLYQNRRNWYVAVFTRNVVDSTPYYRRVEIGNMGNPSRDSVWQLKIPMNGTYTFKCIAVYRYKASSVYSIGNWVFSQADNSIYVSLINLNTENALSDLTSWRKWSFELDVETVFTKTTNGVSNTYLYQALSKEVSCSTGGTSLRMEKSCSSSCSELVISDITGFFDFGLNPTGYGMPYADRPDFGYFVTVKKILADSVEIIPAKGYNATGSYSYSFEIKTDGWYRFQLWKISKHTSYFPYNAGDIVFSDDSQMFYKSLISSNDYPLINTAAWKIATVEDFLDEDAYAWDYLVTCNSEETLSRVAAEIQKCSGCVDKLVAQWAYLYQFLFSAKMAMKKFRFSDAQKIIAMIPRNYNVKGGCSC